MPLIQKQQLNPHTILGIWQTEESLEELLALLPHHVDCTQIAQAHDKRKKEWLASRVLVYTLLKQFTAAHAVLRKDENGKPYFENVPLYLSISHSPALAAVIISDKYEVGIDIELLSQKALRVAGKFLGEDEKKYTAQDENKTCLYWSAKETLYKLYSRKQLIFKDNLILAPTDAQNVLLGEVKTANFSKLYRIHFEFLQNHVLTYCIDELQA
ncbi:4'-phosphopantetheinyl transferase superfamily protein [Pontibacter cellulosilyticus]|uniref:Enterobactin synthase component D n=1 Tax=Pontibacter cellulosilyticus TaxID=1720253 RepID=A0A923N5T4_9BACT|nr:4'-phosphopantetheinyl transferase superfamily protein [Pontibacter cellulosilyticus]MBC5993133.1 4'-phosphopantetheinyl transferase superfamily protein [Pontibacter cellulosilyticus]